MIDSIDIIDMMIDIITDIIDMIIHVITNCIDMIIDVIIVMFIDMVISMIMGMIIDIKDELQYYQWWKDESMYNWIFCSRIWVNLPGCSEMRLCL